MNSTPLLARRRWDPWPVSIISFFVIAIAGCVTFVTFCSRHPADLISPNYYEEEVKYQGQIDRLQHTQERAVAARVSFEPATRSIAIWLPAGEADVKPSGSIQLYRPSELNQDRTFKLAIDSNGVQRLDGSALLPGLWKVRVSWTVNSRGFFIDEKIVVPPTVL